MTTLTLHETLELNSAQDLRYFNATHRYNGLMPLQALIEWYYGPGVAKKFRSHGGPFRFEATTGDTIHSFRSDWSNGCWRLTDTSTTSAIEVEFLPPSAERHGWLVRERFIANQRPVAVLANGILYTSTVDRDVRLGGGTGWIEVDRILRPAGKRWVIEFRTDAKPEKWERGIYPFPSRQAAIDGESRITQRGRISDYTSVVEWRAVEIA